MVLGLAIGLVDILSFILNGIAGAQSDSMEGEGFYTYTVCLVYQLHLFLDNHKSFSHSYSNAW